MQEAVLQELRRRIHDGELRPGTVIRVDAVAGALGVSRIPVREALMILEGEGLVTHRPHVGFAVRASPPRSSTTSAHCSRTRLYGGQGQTPRTRTAPRLTRPEPRPSPERKSVV